MENRNQKRKILLLGVKVYEDHLQEFFRSLTNLRKKRRQWMKRKIERQRFNNEVDYSNQEETKEPSVSSHDEGSKEQDSSPPSTNETEEYVEDPDVTNLMDCVQDCTFKEVSVSRVLESFDNLSLEEDKTLRKNPNHISNDRSRDVSLSKGGSDSMDSSQNSVNLKSEKSDKDSSSSESQKAFSSVKEDAKDESGSERTLNFRLSAIKEKNEKEDEGDEEVIYEEEEEESLEDIPRKFKSEDLKMKIDYIEDKLTLNLEKQSTICMADVSLILEYLAKTDSKISTLFINACHTKLDCLLQYLVCPHTSEKETLLSIETLEFNINLIT